MWLNEKIRMGVVYRLKYVLTILYILFSVNLYFCSRIILYLFVFQHKVRSKIIELAFQFST